MKNKSLLATGVLIVSSALSFAAPDKADTANKQMQIYPKNLARQNVGTNLFVFNATNQSYVPTEAAAAWLDDDVATGWPAAPGKSFYLVSLAEPQLITNIAISTKAGSTGTVTIYASDEIAPPTSKSWTPLAKDLTIESINDKTLAKPFSRFAKYLLIETNLTDPSPWYSLYLYGDKTATAYHMEKRAKAIDTNSMFGPFVNNQTMFNLSSLYAKGMVVYSNVGDSAVALQKSIDDNPETGIAIASSKNESGAIVRFSEARSIQRLSVLADPSAKGLLEFFFVSSLPASVSAPAAGVTSNAQDSQYIKVVNPQSTTPVDAAPSAVSLEGLSPNVKMVLDGTTGRGSIDFPAQQAGYMIIRWTPQTAGQNISIREINTFGDYSLNDYELVSDAPAIGELTDASKEGDPKDAKDSKEQLPAVGDILPSKDPFLPSTLGFPPNIPRALSP